jgi:hypothetical protein
MSRRWEAMSTFGGPSRIGVDRAVTIMVDLARDQAGCLHARLLDAVVGRSGSVYKSWLMGPVGANCRGGGRHWRWVAAYCAGGSAGFGAVSSP